VFDLCDWIFVLDRGRLLTAGTPAAVSNDEGVMEAYAGSGAAPSQRPRRVR